MDMITKERLAKTRQTDKESAGLRLKAARRAAGLSLEELGQIAGLKKATISNAENGHAYPGRGLMIVLFREYQIDFNFLIHGEFHQLPGHVQDKLFRALSSLNSE